MEGLSVKTIMLNTFCQFIIFLYLLDNDTSWLILISAGVGLLIECWKIQKGTHPCLRACGDIAYAVTLINNGVKLTIEHQGFHKAE